MDSVWARGMAVYPSPLNCSDWVSPVSAQTVEVVRGHAAPVRPAHPPIPEPNVGVAFRPAGAAATGAAAAIVPNIAVSTSICTDDGGVPIMTTPPTAVAAPSGEVTDMELPVSALPAGTSTTAEETVLISVPVPSYQTT